MAFRDLGLCALTFPDATPEAALRAGLALAARIGGDMTLNTVAVRMPPHGSQWSGLSAGIEALGVEEEGLSRAAAQQLAAIGKSAAASIGRQLEIEPLTAVWLEEAPVLCRAARTRDLTLMPVGDAVLAGRSLAEAVLIGSGRPVLVFPETLPPPVSAPFARVAIAWDGGASAARAVAEALPILRTATEVRIVAVDVPKPAPEAPTPEALAAHLARHRVSAKVWRQPAAGQSVGEALDAYVAAEAPELMVMGGYGHGRIREALLGGVTRRMMDAPPAPLWLSH
ncbi:MAG: universal stress protein [Proteobacteria bacterium]|nr:universal stress protein [Pseudomonadota bacterium]